MREFNAWQALADLDKNPGILAARQVAASAWYTDLQKTLNAVKLPEIQKMAEVMKPFATEQHKTRAIEMLSIPPKSQGTFLNVGHGAETNALIRELIVVTKEAHTKTGVFQWFKQLSYVVRVVEFFCVYKAPILAGLSAIGAGFAALIAKLRE